MTRASDVFFPSAFQFLVELSSSEGLVVLRLLLALLQWDARQVLNTDYRRTFAGIKKKNARLLSAIADRSADAPTTVEQGGLSVLLGG